MKLVLASRFTCASQVLANLWLNKTLMCNRSAPTSVFCLCRHGRSTTGQPWTLISASRQTTCNGCKQSLPVEEQSMFRLSWQSADWEAVHADVHGRHSASHLQNSQHLLMLLSMISSHGLCYQYCQLAGHSLLSSHKVLATAVWL